MRAFDMLLIIGNSLAYLFTYLPTLYNAITQKQRYIYIYAHVRHIYKWEW